MLNIQKIIMRNFFSFGNAEQEIILDNNDLTLVIGQNNDADNSDNSERRNGVGKSAIIQGIVFGLYGKSVGNLIKIPNLVNKLNTKNCEVSIEFTKDGKNYLVQRGRNPSYFRFKEMNNDGEYIDYSRGEQKDTQEELTEVLGISQTLFEHIIVMNANVDPFLMLSAGKQRDMIEELLGITQLTEKSNLLKEMYKESKKKAEQEKFKIDTITESNNKINASIESLKYQSDLFDNNTSTELSQINEALQQFNGIDFDSLIKDAEIREEQLKKNEERSRLESRVNELGTKVQNFTNSTELEKQKIKKEIDSLSNIDISTELENHRLLQRWKEINEWNSKGTQSIKMFDLQILQHKKTISMIQNNISTEQNKLNDMEADTCPLCKGEINHNEHEDYKNSVLNKIKELNEQLSSTELEIQNLEDKKSMVTFEDLFDKPSTVYSSESEAKLHEHKLSQLHTSYNNPVLNPYEEDFIKYATELENTPIIDVIDAYNKSDIISLQNDKNNLLSSKSRLEGTVNPYSGQIKTLEDNSLQEVSYDEYDRLNTIAEHQDFLIKLLTNKDSFVRKRIIEQNIQFLNTRLEYYINRVGSQQDVIFMNDLSVEIELYGQNYDYSQLSRGERTRVNIALSFAFRDVYEALYQSINLMLIDELIDVGLDPDGVYSVWSVLQDLSVTSGKSIYVISHREELLSKAYKILKVQKEDSFSSVEFCEKDDIL